MEDQHWHWSLILEYCNLSSDSNVEIQMQDGIDSLPVLVLASLSPMLKDYLLDIDTLEPLVTIPDLPSHSFSVFKRYLFASDISEMVNTQDIKTVEKVLRILRGEEDEIIEVEAPKKPKKEKTIPKIMSHSRYGRRQRKSPIHTKEFIEYHSGSDYDEFQSDIEDTEVVGHHTCHYCSKEYHHVNARNRHMIADHLDQCTKDGILFSCTSCSAVFASVLGLKKHSRQKHPQPTTSTVSQDAFSCPFEHEHDTPELTSFEKLKDLHKHVKETHPDKDKSCLGCAQEFNSLKALDDHIQTHSGTPYGRPFFHCVECSRVFQKEYSLVVHKRNEHSTLKEVLHCRFCDKDFKNAKFLKNHEAKHAKESNELADATEDHLCPNCGKSFPSKLNLDRHIKSKHHKIKDHQCPDCGKKFVDSTRLKEHRWIHTDHKPFPCSHCDKGFRHKSHLKHHQAKEHGTAKPFECEHCHKTFCYRYELVNHSSTHQNPKKRTKVMLDFKDLDQQLTQVVFACALCQEHFSTMNELKEHTIANHQDENALVYIENNEDDQILDQSNFTIEFEYDK